jgi:hypothetical protein
MTLQRYNLLLFLFLLLFTSCEKVIDIDVDDAAPKYVIEGVLHNESGGCVVRVSQTKAFHASNDFAGVAGAGVRITDESGAAVQLAETSRGIYQASLVGVPGKTYTLQVNIGSETFTATSRMPDYVGIDSLYTSFMDWMGEKEYYVNVLYTDPPQKGNAYRFVLYINGTKTNDLFGQNDDLSNGRRNTASLFSEDDLQDDLKPGDELRVELQSIDPQVYQYWFSLWQGATGEGNAASPANPVTNIRGGALGYFSAHTISTRSVILK